VTLTFDPESSGRVACDVGYLCANFVFLGLTILDLGPMYATDGQTEVRQKHRLIPCLLGVGHNKQTQRQVSRRANACRAGHP